MGHRKQYLDENGQKIKWCSFGKHFQLADSDHWYLSGGYSDGFLPTCKMCCKVKGRGGKPFRQSTEATAGVIVLTAIDQCLSEEYINKLRLLEIYESLKRTETSARFMALRCFLITGNISLASAFYKRLIIIGFAEKVGIA